MAFRLDFVIGVQTGMSDVTRILNAIERGEQKATDELLPLAIGV